MTVRFSAEAEPEPARRERWHDLITASLGPIEPHGVPDELLLGDAGPVVVGELVQHAPGGATRTRRHLRAVERDVVKVDVLAAGEGVVEQDGRQAHLRAGDLVFVDLTRPARWRMSAGLRWVAVVFPPSALPLARDELARLTAVRIPGGEGAAALASSFARQLPQHLDAPRAERLGTAALDLLTVALTQGESVVPVETRERALVLRVRVFIEERLGDPALAPPMIAAAHHVSLRYLHKLFESEHTTVAALIRERRLERCRRDMLDPALRAQPVSAIASRWGLTNPAHFSRLFRAAYGSSPAEFRALAA